MRKVSAIGIPNIVLGLLGVIVRNLFEKKDNGGWVISKGKVRVLGFVVVRNEEMELCICNGGR